MVVHIFGGQNIETKATSFIDLRNNGKLFPIWIMKNFKKYKLPDIIIKENEDPCHVNIKLELRKYQLFIGQYLGPQSPYNEILLYHGLGSGKTATTINLLNILYNYNHNINAIILIKASLHEDPWMKDLKVWLDKEPEETGMENVTKLRRFQNLHFVHYDSPYADKSFLDTMKTLDTTKPTIYIIDEVHNFMRNVYSNINTKLGKRAHVIYEYILREKKENRNTKIVLISATPSSNNPFELALMFNLLRPGIFPSSELEFNRLFITQSAYPILNPLKKNLFQRRILGLVSYYVGATADLYAKQDLFYVNLPISQYQYQVYRTFEKIEAEIQNKSKKYGRSSKLYRTYTRQACNFVFPYVNINVTGELRPRPGKYRLNEKVAEDIQKGKIVVNEKTEQITINKPEMELQGFNMVEKEAMIQYFKALEYFLTETEKHFNNIKKEDEREGKTIQSDLEEFKKGFHTKYYASFLNFYQSKNAKSKLFYEMYDSSPKMLAIGFLSYLSPGKVMVYSNYVILEGIDMMKVYLRLLGFNTFSEAKEFMGYCEYHGRIDPKERIKIKQMFNDINNIYGEKCKIILLSPSATEGIQLLDIRQEHIMEPYWTETRIQQVIGRGVRQCSHKDLPMSERQVSIYRYKIVKPIQLEEDDTNRVTTDEYIEDLAKAKYNLIESFLSAMKEAAVDCELFRAHNMLAQSYHCFAFPEDVVMEKNVGPAYREDIKDDIKFDSGLNAFNSYVEKIKVIKVKAVYEITNVNGETTYSKPEDCWYYPTTGIIYDYETHYPIGKVEFINGLPNKLDKNTFIISDLLTIPSLSTNNP
jgi:superfamily II DNA or RNA helicase